MRVAMLGVGHWHAGMHAKGVADAGAEIAGVWDSDIGAVARFVVALAASRDRMPPQRLTTGPTL